MIKVNWSKIKPFEKKAFALSAMTVLAAIGIALAVIASIVNGPLVILKLIACLLGTAFVGLLIHIESRMLQIYMLQGVFDVLLAISCSKTKGIAEIIIAGILFAILIVALAYEKKKLLENSMYDYPEADRKNIYANKNVLMFAPHEDDEINIYGGIIEQYVKNGSTVRVVFSTNGDVYGLGKLRIKEALDVAKSYGIPEENFIFLGYSDSMKNEKGMHVYNCQPNEKVASVKGYTEAYGIDGHNSFSNKEFTRQNILDDFKAVIEKYMPDVLYCCDYDSHPDHRAIGLFFEEALGEILKENQAYSPKVYKGFAYSLAWMGKLDYYEPNSRSTHQWIVDDMMVESNVYSWAERLRLPVAKETLSHIKQNSSSYKAMMLYSSQTASDHADGILNNDKVFWERRTDSLLYNAEVDATSGDASKIVEFKMVDSVDINDQSLLPSANAWVADENDENRCVVIKLPENKTVSEIVIYESPILENKIKKATIKVGAYQFSVSNLHKGANAFPIEPVEASVIGIRVDEFEGECSILKVEAFEKSANKDIQLIKLMDSKNDFCYDYLINHRGREDFFIYQYPISNKIEYEITTTGDVSYIDDLTGLQISCPKGKEGTVTVRSKENPDVYDVVRISNPTKEQLKKINKMQSFEPNLWTLPMQYDYYIGLVRRLGVYR